MLKLAMFVYLLFSLLVVIFDVILMISIKNATYDREANLIVYKIVKKDGKYVAQFTPWIIILQIVVMIMLAVTGIITVYSLYAIHESDTAMDSILNVRQRENTIKLDKPTLEAAAQKYRNTSGSL